MKHKNKIVAGVAMAYVVFLGVASIPSVTTYEKIEVPEVKPVVYVQLEVEKPLEIKRQVPSLYPTLKRICSCESTGSPDNEPQQFNADGTVLRGKINPLDTGMCQLNSYYHDANAKSMGLDIETEYGNAVYANWLFETQGSTPWAWSKSCWQ